MQGLGNLGDPFHGLGVTVLAYGDSGSQRVSGYIFVNHIPLSVGLSDVDDLDDAWMIELADAASLVQLIR